jgi:hypothetical protein
MTPPEGLSNLDEGGAEQEGVQDHLFADTVADIALRT